MQKKGCKRETGVCHGDSEEGFIFGLGGETGTRASNFRRGKKRPRVRPPRLQAETFFPEKKGKGSRGRFDAGGVCGGGGDRARGQGSGGFRRRTPSPSKRTGKEHGKSRPRTVASPKRPTGRRREKRVSSSFKAKGKLLVRNP